MARQLVECVPNFSEGRDASIIDAIAAAVRSVPQVALLDRTSDADHNRSVLTFAGPPDAVAEAAVRAVAKAVELIDLRMQQGAHPRIGAADVVPFVPIEGITLEDCSRLAERVAYRLWNELRLPIYLYEAAARRPERVNLENIRRGQFETLVREMGTVATRDPDVGEPVCHPSAGATVVGARKFLIAYNVNLDTADVSVAKDVAKAIRQSSGGLPFVKSMGVMLASRNLAQVSNNLTDFEQTPVHVVFEAIRREAAGRGVGVAGSEIIGLIPRRAIEMSAAHFLSIEQFRRELILENRLDQVAAARGGLAEFLDAMASPADPTGGGSASAAASAMAAALGVLVSRLSHQPVELFEQDRRYFTEAVDRDATAYQRVVEGVPGALRGATEVPLEVLERLADMQERLEGLIVSEALISDLNVARSLTVAAQAGALENVRINLASLPDESFKASVFARLAKLERR